MILPDTLRIAVLNFQSNSGSYYGAYWNNEEYLNLQQEYFRTLETALAPHRRVQKIKLMPKLMIGTQPNIFSLREAAVRLQADLLLIFSVNSNIYYKYKVFKKNEAKAFATCEALLMDIRTGIIPYSEVVTREQLLRKSEEDFNNLDLQKNAERQAVVASLEEIGKRIFTFLGQD